MKTEVIDQQPESTPLNFDEQALVKPGAYLVSALLKRADERGQKLVELAAELNVTYGYINQLRSGNRSTKQISDEFTTACATYLGIPRLAVLVFAGQITLSDLFDKVEVLQAEIPRAMEYLSKDPVWGLLVTTELLESSFESKYCLIRLYEKATDRQLLPASLDLEEFGKAFERLTKARAEKMKARGIKE